MLSSRRVRWLAFAALAGAVLDTLVASATDSAEQAPAAAPITAIWQVQRVDFVYNSNSVRYSCGNLQRRIAAILQAVGAHSNIGVELGCNSGELVRYANVHLTLAVPIEATDENVRAATDFGTRDALVA